MSNCLDENRFAALLDGRLPEDERDASLRHINGCPPCFQTWLSLAQNVQDPALCETLISGAGPEEEPSLLGRTLAGFVVTRELGRGAMGVVYEALHPQIRQRAAVKVLFPAYSADPQYMRRFRLEARAASAVSHPGLATMFNFGQLPEGTAYLMMEYLEGESLHERMKARRLTCTEALRHARQVASAMAAVHEHDIVHRDLKPANVMLVADVDVKGGERAKVVDFGLARFHLSESLRRAPGASSLSAGTALGAFLGTVIYASPEQCMRDQRLGGPSDVYSLGVMLYEMLSGRWPFGGTVPEVMAKHVTTAPPPLREAAPEVPAGACALVHEMLAKAPAQRPTMAQVRDRIDRLLAGRGRRMPHRAWLALALLLAGLAYALSARP